MFSKIAFSQEVLKRLSQYSQHPHANKMVAGAALAGGYGLVRSGIDKGKEYHAGFYPNYMSR